MWIFSGKSADSSGGGGVGSSVSSVLGAHSSDDPLSGYALDPSSLVEEPLPGPYDLHWIRQYSTPRVVKPGIERVCVFSCRVVTNSPAFGAISTALLQVVKRMKTLRHPNILTWLAGSENVTKNNFHIVTEEVRPLREYLRAQSDSSGSGFALLASWGIYQVTRALGFLNDDCRLSHNVVCADAVYVNKSGEWKLGRLDYVTPLAEAAEQKLNTPRPAAYVAPNGHCIDAWGLACLIWEVFNVTPLTEASQLASKASLERLPRPLVAPFRRLLSTKAPLTSGAAAGGSGKVRSTFAAPFLKVGYFKNDYIDTLLFLEEIQLKDKEEKATFLARLGQRAVSMFPDDVCRYKILPVLVTSLQYGSSGVEALMPVLELSHLLPPAAFEAEVVPGVVRLFSSPERATRVRLLDLAPRFVARLPPRLLETAVFPPVAAGFADANPLVREATVRAMVHLAPHLPSRLLNDAVLRHLTTLEFKDDQGGIRTNATICLAKLAGRFEPSIRRGPLLNALLRATRDPFAPSRQAAVTALAACQVFFSAQDLAGKVIPCLSFVTVDADKDIRTTAIKALRGMIERIEKASEDESAGEADTSVLGAPAASGPSAAIAAGGKITASIGNWALTALSSLSSRLITSSAAHASTTTAGSTGASQQPKTALDESKPPTTAAASSLQKSTPMAAAEPSPKFKVTDWQDDEEEGEEKDVVANVWNSPGKKPSDSWRAFEDEEEEKKDADDGDGAGGWGEQEDVDFGSLSLSTKPSPPSKPLTVKTGLLIDWETPAPPAKTSPSPFGSKASPLVSKTASDNCQWDVEDQDMDEGGWSSTASPKAASRKPASLTSSTWSRSKAGSLSPIGSVGKTPDMGAWARAKPAKKAPEEDFFEAMLSQNTSSKVSSIGSGRQSPASGSLRMQPVAKAPAKETRKEENDGWDAW